MAEQTPQGRWCFSWIPERAGGPGKDRAALLNDAKWQPGDVITVAFLDGDPAVQGRVRDVAGEWTGPGMADLTFDFRTGPDALIRISFRHAGSWSLLGTMCRLLPDPSRATMNYGWLTRDSDDDELRRVVLHEFGHALGLIHEHQNPAGGIAWDRPAVIRDLSGPPNDWTPDVIERNMFQPYAASETNFSDTDRDSIMMYPIPPHWTTNGFSVGLNGELSAGDKAFIREAYAG